MDKLLKLVEEQAKVIDELTQSFVELEAYFTNRLDQLEKKIELLILRCEDDD